MSQVIEKAWALSNGEYICEWTGGHLSFETEEVLHMWRIDSTVVHPLSESIQQTVDFLLKELGLSSDG